MTVVNSRGTPLFGGKTLVLSAAVFKGRPKPASTAEQELRATAKPAETNEVAGPTS